MCARLVKTGPRGGGSVSNASGALSAQSPNDVVGGLAGYDSPLLQIHATTASNAFPIDANPCIRNHPTCGGARATCSSTVTVRARCKTDANPDGTSSVSFRPTEFCLFVDAAKCDGGRSPKEANGRPANLCMNAETLGLGPKTSQSSYCSAGNGERSPSRIHKRGNFPYAVGCRQQKESRYSNAEERHGNQQRMLLEQAPHSVPGRVSGQKDDQHVENDQW